MLSGRCPVCLSVTFVHCGQTLRWIKIKRCMQVGLGPRHIMLHGDLAPPPQRGTAPRPIFCPYLLWPNGCPIKIPLGMEVGLNSLPATPADFSSLTCLKRFLGRTDLSKVRIGKDQCCLNLVHFD